MPRKGAASEVRWFKGPPGVHAYHVMNAFDEGDQVHLDLCLSETNAFPFIRADSKILREQWEIGGGFIRWTMNLKDGSNGVAARPLGPPGDLPRIRDADQGRPYRAAWYLSMDPKGGPPLPGGPVGAAMNCLLRIEPATGRIDSLTMPFGWAINEPVHVPVTHGSQGDGWLMAVVDEQRGDDYLSQLWIIDATDISAGPVAKVPLPIRQRPQVHGWWVPMNQLDQSVYGA
jgi:carotenoid cleavage dioxygenase